MTILESELESKSESESELESESGLGLQRKPKFSVIQITWRTQALIRSPPLRSVSSPFILAYVELILHEGFELV